MPLLGGDSNSFWRFDIKFIIKAFFVLVLLRGISILLDIYPTYIPVIDDVVNGLIALLHWTSISFNRMVGQHFSF